MATRKGVGASIASAIIFSSLLVSNYVLFSAEQQNLQLASVASEERHAYDQALVVRSVAVLDLLVGAQRTLASRTFTCSNASAAVYRLLAAEVVRVGWDGFRARAVLLAGPDSTLADNLTSLQPFNGSVKGWSNFEALTSVEGASPDESVAYSKDEVHLVNIPLRLEALSEVCVEAAGVVSSALARAGAQLCNSTSLALTLESISPALTLYAESIGFFLSLDSTVIAQAPCRVAYGVVVSQGSVLGPEGPFTFVAQESGILSS
ncbi:MAG: hypothetical protein LYZ70_05755 [Nitrososphaerales archaeon]|nr:hypothetical protein [Nitrososphaerales archaeon]